MNYAAENKARYSSGENKQTLINLLHDPIIPASARRTKIATIDSMDNLAALRAIEEIKTLIERLKSKNTQPCN